jgi:hypothetical protein
MADFAPQLTLDFISEVAAAMTAMDKNSSRAATQRVLCLQYLKPWIRNLSQFSDPTSPHFERSGARLRDCIRVLCDSTVAFPEVCSLLNYARMGTYLPW